MSDDEEQCTTGVLNYGRDERLQTGRGMGREGRAAGRQSSRQGWDRGRRRGAVGVHRRMRIARRRFMSYSIPQALPRPATPVT